MGTQQEILNLWVWGPERGRSKCEVSGKTEKGVDTKSGHYCQVLRKVLPEGDQSAIRVVGAQTALVEQGSELERKEEEDEQEAWVRALGGFNPPGAAGTRVSPDAAGPSRWS